MLETGVRQVRVALAMVFGRPLNVGLVERLVEDALATLDEFGSPGEDVEQLIDGPFADPADRRDLQTRALQRTARRLHRSSRFYRERLDAAGIDPGGLTLETLRSVPVTVKRDLVDRGKDFICGRPYLATQTTGTTGVPVRVWLSRYEIELWPALIALSMLLRGEIRPGDCMQMNLSSRATAAMQEDLAMLRLAGAAGRVVGQVAPDESLDHLLDGVAPPTILNGYPSYIGQLVTAARRRGLGPADFRLRALYVGGEVLSPHLAEAVRATFGIEQVNDTYGATELLPVGGRTCNGGHVHLDPNMGYAEVLDLETGEPAEPGGLGTLTVTPYYPYRDCMPVLRYDTRDIVRALPEPLDCELSAVPAVSQILGKESRLLRTGDGVVTQRDVVEALDGLPGVEWPVRHRARVDAGRLHVTVVAPGLSTTDVVERFAGRGIDATAEIADLDEQDARRLCPLRCDLREETFVRGAA
ncbi:phenylacetate--CoA ligase family protein [Spirillospora sp. NBC_01491]|uniref:phenylacetate--CoA ligase family protein n=1 Tax=Spirillospora sp. NBC_01491 TaxID=2976007 RepID=UPI002E2FB90B|nr:AMP-binding protein [Spirillospora sp. NBC_01491]